MLGYSEGRRIVAGVPGIVGIRMAEANVIQQILGRIEHQAAGTAADFHFVDREIPAESSAVVSTFDSQNSTPYILWPGFLA